MGLCLSTAGMCVHVFAVLSSGSGGHRKQDVVRVLEANKIESEEVDVTLSEAQKQWVHTPLTLLGKEACSGKHCHLR